MSLQNNGEIEKPNHASTGKPGKKILTSVYRHWNRKNQDSSVSTRICMDQATDSKVDRQHHQGIPHWDLYLLGNKWHDANGSKYWECRTPRVTSGGNITVCTRRATKDHFTLCCSKSLIFKQDKKEIEQGHLYQFRRWPWSDPDDEIVLDEVEDGMTSLSVYDLLNGRVMELAQRLVIRYIRPHWYLSESPHRLWFFNDPHAGLSHW